MEEIEDFHLQVDLEIKLMNKDIFLSNSLGGEKQKFIPINDKNIGMYVCGPTVYDDPHIGNARPIDYL